MKITVFGATGRVGRRVVETLAARGDEVTALVRRPERAAGLPARLTVGDVRDPGAVRVAVDRAEAVISCLASEGVHAPGTTLSVGMANIVAAMSDAGAERIVAVGVSGLLDDPRGGLRRDQPGYPEIFLEAGREHERAWKALEASDLAWTFVCPPHLPEGEPTGAYRVAADRLPAGEARATTGDVAAFLVDELAARHFVGHRVGIVSPADFGG